MPIGRSVVIRRIAASRLRAGVRMSPPSRIAIARPMPFLPFTRRMGCGGVRCPAGGGGAGCGGGPAVGDEVDVPDVLVRVEGARDAERERLRTRLDRPGWQDQVLRPERVDELRLVQAEARELPGGELDEDRLVLGAEQLDLLDIR